MKKWILISLFVSMSFIGFGQKDKSFKLEKIVFHTTGCVGDCPTYHMEIDNKKYVKLFSEEVFKKYSTNRKESIIDSSRVGYFEGKIDDTNYNKLKQIIKNCDIETLTFDGSICCDGSIITIIVYYNGKRKYLKSMNPPAVAEDLIKYFHDIFEKNTFHLATEQFTIKE